MWDLFGIWFVYMATIDGDGHARDHAILTAFGICDGRIFPDSFVIRTSHFRLERIDRFTLEWTANSCFDE